MKDSPFWGHIGMKESVKDNGYAEVTLDIFPEILQRRGVVHGGVLASLIDGSIGAAVRSTLEEGQGSATVELKINYIRPAKGKSLTAKASLSHRGGTLAVGKSEIFDDNDQLVAMGSATFVILKKNGG